VGCVTSGVASAVLHREEADGRGRVGRASGGVYVAIEISNGRAVRRRQPLSLRLSSLEWWVLAWARVCVTGCVEGRGRAGGGGPGGHQANEPGTTA
jgi:drug/metabolite transporter superfamily protein YnfA